MTLAMKKLIQTALASALLIATASCSSMSKKDCETANWAALGQKDAEDGQTLDAFKRRENQCFEHGLLTDRETYLRGYNSGLKVFCTYEAGQKFGYSERTYGYQCPKTMETDFLRGYKLGKTEAERDRAESAREEERRQEQARLEEERRHHEDELRRQQEEIQRQQDELNRQ